MKKKSILLTCIVAIMALAMFVGCDNAPTIPSFIVGGNISQTGDFLTGQTFDPTKFSVTVRYDNGRILPAEDVSVVLKETEANGTVEAGDKVEVYLGKNFESQDITAKAGIRVYDINSITVEGPESYVGKETPTNSELKVTANYLDNTGAEKTMVLRSTEFVVKAGGYSNGNVGPNAAQESVTGYVTVIPTVGQMVEANKEDQAAVQSKYEFTATFEPAELPGVIESIVSVSFKTGTVLPAWNYEEMPVPSFDDLLVYVKYAGKDYTGNTAGDLLDVDPGIELVYVTSDGAAVTSTDFSDTSKSYRAQATYEGMTVQTTNANGGSGAIGPKAVTLAIAPADSFAKMEEGTDLPALSADDFIIVAYCNNTVVPFDESKVELAFSTAAATVTAPTDGKVPAYESDTAKEDLYVVAECQGAKGSVDVTSYITEAATTAYNTTANGALTIETTASYEKPAAQYYDDINTVIDALTASDVTVKFTDPAATSAVTVVPTKLYYATSVPSVSADKVEATLLSEATKDAVTGYNLPENKALYIVAEYNAVDKDGNTTIYVAYDAVADGTTTKLTAGVADKDGAQVVLGYAKTEEGETPLIGATVSSVKFSTRNANGYVMAPTDIANNHTNYTLLVDGVTIESAKWGDVAVTSKAQTVEVYTTPDDYMVAEATIPAGVDYVAAPSTDITVALNDTGKAKILKVGDVVADVYNVNDFTATATYKSGAKETVEIVGLNIPSTYKVIGTTYAVPVVVSYVGANGEDTYVASVSVSAIEYIEPSDEGFAMKCTGIEEALKDGDSIPAGQYTRASFTLDTESYIPHLDSESDVTDFVSVSLITVDRSSGSTGVWTESDTSPKNLSAGDYVTFTVSYVDGTSAEAEAEKATYEIELRVVEAAN